MAFNEANKIKQAIKEFNVAIDDMVTIMGNDAVNFYKDSFIQQGFVDDGLKKWKGRKRVDRKRPGRGILVDTGALRRSLRARKIDRYTIRMESNVAYSVVHNEGLRSGRGKGFVMQKRQFVGNSRTLNNRLTSKFAERINRIFK